MCVLLGYMNHLSEQGMAETVESVFIPSPENVVDSPEETDLGLLDEYYSSDCIGDVTTTLSLTKEELYHYKTADAERKRFCQNVISQWQKGGERQVYLSFWDYAGQSTYYSTHQAFMSANAVYLIVFDLSKDLDTQLDDSLNFAMGGLPKSSVSGKLYSRV